jgi:hypothetical protein
LALMKHIVLSNTRDIFTYIVGLNSSALNTPAEKPAEKPGLVGLSGRPRTLPGLIGQQACTIPIVEHAKPQ